MDYNVYTQDANPKPKGTRTNLRSAGFHIHIGYDNPNIDDSLKLIRYLDAFLGLPSLLLDDDTNRRSLYGKAGCFRLTSYGAEYRTLSSAMMEDSISLNFVWNQLTKAINSCNYNIPLPPANKVQTAIDNSDIDLAKELIEEYKLA